MSVIRYLAEEDLVIICVLKELIQGVQWSEWPKRSETQRSK